jgi:Ni/Co efflux regulator RcnB
MRKTILTIFASALLAGTMIEAATAAEHHNVRRTTRTAPVVVVEPFRDSYAYDRNAYGSSYPDYSYWTSHLEGGAISAPAGH